MKISLALLLSIIITICLSSRVSAAIVINEFSYQTSSDWVELYNSDCENVNLEGWKIKDSTESQFKSLTGVIQGKSVTVFDLTFLNNSTPDKIRLFSPDSLSQSYTEVSIPIQDFTPVNSTQTIGLEVDGVEGWKIFDTNSKNELNSVLGNANQNNCPTPTPTPTDHEEGGSNNQQFNPSGSFKITEVMPDPETGDEWVEILNTSNQSIDISQFQVDDLDGGSKPQNLPKVLLTPNQYYVHFTSSVFNNAGDSIRILYQSTIIDIFSYTNSTKGISFAIDSAGNWRQTTDPTPGESNSIVFPITPTPTATPTLKPSPTQKPSPTPKKTKTPTPVKVKGVKIATASAISKDDHTNVKTSGNSENKSNNNYYPLYVASLAISLSFLLHALYIANKKTVHKRLKKSKLIKKFKSVIRIV